LRQARSTLSASPQKRLLREITRLVLENVGDELISLYAIGSFVSREMIESSDIDLVGVFKPSFDFREEARINRELNHSIRCRHKIDLGTMSYDEFLGETPKGSLMKYIELPILLSFLKNAKLVHGRRINFDELPIKPASPAQQLTYWIRVFNEYKSDFRRKDRVRPDFTFKDFIKIIFYLANLEVQLSRRAPKQSYFEIAKAFRKNRRHIVHYSLRLRRKKTIRNREKQLWLDLAEEYVQQMRARSKA